MNKKYCKSTINDGIFKKDFFDSVFLMVPVMIATGLFCGIAMEWNVSETLLLFLVVPLLSQWIIEMSQTNIIFIHLTNIMTTIIFPPHEKVSRVTKANKYYSVINGVSSLSSVCNDVLPLLVTSIINLIHIRGDGDNILSLLSIRIIICCALKSWCNSLLFCLSNHSTTVDAGSDHSGESPQSPQSLPTTPDRTPQQQQDKHDVSAASQRMTNEEVSQLSSDNNNDNYNGGGSAATNTILITIIDLKNVFEQLFMPFVYLSTIIYIINDTSDGGDLTNKSLCIRNIINYNFGIIMRILCIYLIKILLNCFQAFQFIFKLIFYVFSYNTMSVCSDNYQHPISTNIGILYGLFDVFCTNNINTFIQIIFGTIGMYFITFWSWIKNYISFNNNNNHNHHKQNSKNKIICQNECSIIMAYHCKFN